MFFLLRYCSGVVSCSFMSAGIFGCVWRAECRIGTSGSDSEGILLRALVATAGAKSVFFGHLPVL